MYDPTAIESIKGFLKNGSTRDPLSCEQGVPNMVPLPINDQGVPNMVQPAILLIESVIDIASVIDLPTRTRPSVTSSLTTLFFEHK